MKKSIITIVAFMLFALAGFAQTQDIVYIRVVTINGGKNLKAIVSENGTISETEMPSGVWVGKHADEIAPFVTLLNKYCQKGYKIVSSMVAGTYKEYILQKD